MIRSIPIYLIALTICGPAGAAEIFVYDSDEKAAGIAITGEIKPGDFAKFQRLLTDEERVITSVRIHSPGGNLIEAMRIGELVRQRLLAVTTVDTVDRMTYGKQGLPDWWPSSVEADSFFVCNSACFVVWVAGVQRDGGTIPLVDGGGTAMGLHRPSFDPKYFASLSVDDATSKYAELVSVLLDYLKRMNVPESIIEKLLVVPSNDVYFLSTAELASLSGRLPAIDEWLISKCLDVQLSRQEKADFDELVSRKHSSLSRLEKRYLESLFAQWRAYNSCRSEALFEAQTDSQSQ